MPEKEKPQPEAPGPDRDDKIPADAEITGIYPADKWQGRPIPWKILYEDDTTCWENDSYEGPLVFTWAVSKKNAGKESARSKKPRKGREKMASKEGPPKVRQPAQTTPALERGREAATVDQEGVVTAYNRQLILPCPVEGEKCEIEEATYVWRKPTREETCPYYLSRDVKGVEVMDENGDNIFVSSDGSMIRLKKG